MGPLPPGSNIEPPLHHLNFSNYSLRRTTAFSAARVNIRIGLQYKHTLRVRCAAFADIRPLMAAGNAFALLMVYDAYKTWCELQFTAVGSAERKKVACDLITKQLAMNFTISMSKKRIVQRKCSFRFRSPRTTLDAVPTRNNVRSMERGPVSLLRSLCV